MCKECSPERTERIARMERNAYRVGTAQTGVTCAAIVAGSLGALNWIMGLIESIDF